MLNKNYTQTVWKKAAGYIIAGQTLTVIIVDFWLLRFIMPLLGGILLLLGFRMLKNENLSFKINFVLSAVKLAFLIFDVFLNATVFKSDVEELSVYRFLKFVPALLMLAVFYFQMTGIMNIRLKMGISPRAGAAGALVIWYILLAVLYLAVPSFTLVWIVAMACYGFIIYRVYILYCKLEISGYAVKPTDFKLSNRLLTVSVLTVTLLGIVCGYMFFSSYQSEWRTWQPPADSEDAELADISAKLLSLGFPENVLHDIQAQDIKACAGALRVVTDVKDHHGEKGKIVRSVTDEGVNRTVEYGAENLRITSVAVELSSEDNQWKIFRHFLWMSNPGFCGTDAVVVNSANMSANNWLTVYDYDITGQMLYDLDDASYVASYHSLSNIASFLRDKTVTAEFSMPNKGKNHRGYVSYAAQQNNLDALFCDSMEYVHQIYLIQYPVRTALKTKRNIDDDMFFSSDAFITVNDIFNFRPYDETAFNQ